MKDYGLQRSCVKPLDVEITETLVFVASDVKEVHEETTGENAPEFNGFEFQLLEYTKDEYIKLQADEITRTSEELTNTQMALCDVYELLG